MLCTNSYLHNMILNVPCNLKEKYENKYLRKCRCFFFINIIVFSRLANESMRRILTFVHSIAAFILSLLSIKINSILLLQT